jgi:hypothetical protein
LRDDESIVRLDLYVLSEELEELQSEGSTYFEKDDEEKIDEVGPEENILQGGVLSMLIIVDLIFFIMSFYSDLRDRLEVFNDVLSEVGYVRESDFLYHMDQVFYLLDLKGLEGLLERRVRFEMEGLVWNASFQAHLKYVCQQFMLLFTWERLYVIGIKELLHCQIPWHKDLIIFWVTADESKKEELWLHEVEVIGLQKFEHNIHHCFSRTEVLLFQVLSILIVLLREDHYVEKNSVSWALLGSVKRVSNAFDKFKVITGDVLRSFEDVSEEKH